MHNKDSDKLIDSCQPDTAALQLPTWSFREEPRSVQVQTRTYPGNSPANLRIHKIAFAKTGNYILVQFLASCN